MEHEGKQTGLISCLIINNLSYMCCWIFTIQQSSVGTFSASLLLCASICKSLELKNILPGTRANIVSQVSAHILSKSTSYLLELFCNMKTLLPLISLNCSLKSVRRVWVQGDRKKLRMLCSKMLGYNPFLFHWRLGVPSF